MNYLLDTNVFIWWGENPNQLSPTVRDICATPEHTRYLSLASVWEMQIKIQTGKLDLQIPLAQMVDFQMRYAQIRLLPITLDHIYTLKQLVLADHRDPFDRLLIAQAIHENIPILSHDSNIANYPVRVIW